MKLYKKANGKFKLEMGHTSVEGSWSLVSRYLLDHYHMPEQELDAALDEMVDTNSDVAFFDDVRNQFTHACNSLELRWSIVELQAVQDTKVELAEAYKRGGMSIVTREVFDRLGTLALTLNCERVLRVLGAEYKPDEIAA